MNQVEALTVGQLKRFVAQLEQNTTITDETKVFLDTGWDSIQEISPDALSVQQAKQFEIEDELTGERFGGFSLVEKAEKMNATGPEETIVVIQNLY